MPSAFSVGTEQQRARIQSAGMLTDFKTKKFEAKRRSSDKAGADLRAGASLREIG